MDGMWKLYVSLLNLAKGKQGSLANGVLIWMIAYTTVVQIAIRWSEALKVGEMDKHPTYTDEIY